MFYIKGVVHLTAHCKCVCMNIGSGTANRMSERVHPKLAHVMANMEYCIIIDLFRSTIENVTIVTRTSVVHSKISHKNRIKLCIV